MNDMPKSDADGFRRVCDERKFAFVGSNMFIKLASNWMSCDVVSLPGTTYPEALTYIISKANHYKGLISWR
jgi:hypothetical protein